MLYYTYMGVLGRSWKALQTMLVVALSVPFLLAVWIVDLLSVIEVFGRRPAPIATAPLVVVPHTLDVASSYAQNGPRGIREAIGYGRSSTTG